MTFYLNLTMGKCYKNGGLEKDGYLGMKGKLEKKNTNVTDDIQK